MGSEGGNVPLGFLDLGGGVREVDPLPHRLCKCFICNDLQRFVCRALYGVSGAQWGAAGTGNASERGRIMQQGTCARCRQLDELYQDLCPECWVQSQHDFADEYEQLRREELES